MPSGFERINVRRRPPNANITFITPLDGRDKDIAQDFLERVAAIVFPIMKEHHLLVTSLVEFPANREFWGRNFNAGEKIELVLKDPKTGSWLPFSFVQAVMSFSPPSASSPSGADENRIHELSHNKHMDHSASFWHCKSRFDGELSRLKARGYTGEGFWSQGRKLLSDGVTGERTLRQEDLPRNLCGGTFRERRKRVGKGKPSAEERREMKKRRIEKKFGTGGVRVGEDEEVRPDGKGKPRVAGSKRGRELRAAAALKRLEGVGKKESEEESGGEGSGEEEEEKVVEVEGRLLVSVSGECDGVKEEEEKGRELRELLGGCATGGEVHDIRDPEDRKVRTKDEAGRGEVIPRAGEENSRPRKKPPVWYELSDTDDEASSTKPAQPKSDTKPTSSKLPPLKSTTNRSLPPEPHTAVASNTCAVCTTINPPDAALCMTCSNLLSTKLHSNAWKCSNAECPPAYRNVGDVRYCGLCGQARR